MARGQDDFSGEIKSYSELGETRLVLSDRGDPLRFETFTFNRNGWLVGWCRNGQAYSCGFDGSALRSVRVGSGGQAFVWSLPLASAELAQEVARAREVIKRWREQSDSRPISLLALSPSEVGERFRRVWGKVAILPPDQYAAAVVQLTQGCAYNGCRFCSFYKDVPYRVRDGAAFWAHLQEVKDFFGSELEERRGIFLADANAANIEDERLEYALRQIGELGKTDPAWSRCWQGGVASFLDTFSRSGRSVERWRSLREAGLTSLYLGVETGSEALRRKWRKPGHPGEIVDLVGRLKAAGVKVGVIVLSGAEAEFAGYAHNGETARLLNALPLDGSDRIYISEYRSDQQFATAEEYVAYRQRCRLATEGLQAELRMPVYPQGPLVSLYDVWQYLYR